MTATATAYEPVIGVEVHVQLATNTKMFCRCRLGFGEAPNTLTCPVCQGQPGALPVVNKRAIEFGIRVGLALNCKVARHTRFDRKNYFYPDLPKGFQISQFDEPLNYDGVLELAITDPTTGQPKRVGIIRAHMEEDTGKSVHMDTFSLLDFNRAGTPLVEIVSAPEMHSPEEAYAYLTTLKRNLSYLRVSSLSMEKGSLRCDLNISLRRAGSTGLPDYKVEVKNLNSFAGGKLALEYEIARQTAMLERGERPAIETRLWDEEKLETRSMRSKETANDYRFFPEPDIPPLVIDPEWVDEIRSTLPEMPDQRLARFLSEYHLRQDHAEAMVDVPEICEFFEQAVALWNHPAKIANWLSTEVGRAMNKEARRFDELSLRPPQVTGILQLLEAGRLNNVTAKEVFAEMMVSGEEAEACARRLNKLIESDSGARDAVIDEVLKEFAAAVEELRAGKEQTLGFLVGQCMRKLQGKANPKELGPAIRQRVLG